MTNEEVRVEFLALKNLKGLCDLLNQIPLLKKDEYIISETKLRGILNNKMECYEITSIPKKNGDIRVIHKPCKELKIIQRKLQVCLESIYSPNESTFGFIKGRNIRMNAKCHVSKSSLLNIDFEDFYPSITKKRIVGVLTSSRYNLNSDLSIQIANICCYKNNLVTGSPCSPIVSNIICEKLDRRLSNFCIKYGITYSRYGDDSSFSTDFDITLKMIDNIKSIIISEGFKINTRKEKLRLNSQSQIVTGIVVNEKVNIKRTWLKELRSMVHNLYIKVKTKSIDKDEVFILSKLINVISGKIAYVFHIKGKRNKIAIKMKEKMELVKELYEYKISEFKFE